MTDLVTRLRDWENVYIEDAYSDDGSLYILAADEIERLEAELDHFKSSGIIEVAVRNPNVSEYMKHWEGRAEKAEAERDQLREAVDAALRVACLPFGIFQSPMDAVSEAEKRIAELEAERDKLREAVWQALDDMGSGLSVCLAAKEMLADAYIRDDDPAEWPTGLGETEICGYCKGGTDENVTHCPVCEGETEK